MPVINQTQLENASLDAQSFESAVNDPANTPNPGHPDGTVTTRTGQTFYNLQASLKGVTDFSSALKWNIDTSSVVIEDPTSGKVRLDNADPSLATQLAISSIDFNVIDVSNFIATWDDSTSTVKGYIIIREGVGTSAFALYTISSLTDNGTWFEINVSYVSGSGSFTDEALIYVAFSRNGDKGADGAGSGDVVGPVSSLDSSVALFDGVTGKLLKEGPLIGTGANNLVQLDGSGALPAVDGSNLTGINAGVSEGINALFTADDTLNTVSIGTDQGYADDDEVYLKSTGTLPGGLDDQTVYFIVNITASTAQLSLTSGGAVIDITTAGTGTHSIFQLVSKPVLRVSRIELSDGSKGVATDYVVDGSAKAWASLTGTGAIALKDSLNVSSVVDNGTGDYTFNFTNAFANTGRVFCSMGNRTNTVNNDALVAESDNPAVGSARTGCTTGSSGAATDLATVYITGIGDLA